MALFFFFLLQMYRSHSLAGREQSPSNTAQFQRMSQTVPFSLFAFKEPLLVTLSYTRDESSAIHMRSNPNPSQYPLVYNMS